MKITALLITVLCMFNAKNKYENWCNPYFIFNALWSTVLVLLIIGNEYVYEPSTIALSCIIIGIVGFNVSILTPKLVIGNKHLVRENVKYALDYKKAVILSFVALVLSVGTTMPSIISFVNGTSFVDIRDDYYTYSTSGSDVMYYFRYYISSPLRYVVIVTAIIATFKKKERRKVLLINTLLIVFCQAITSGGRYVLMNTMFMFICGFFLLENREKITLKRKIMLVIIIILFSYFIIYLTNARATYQSLGMSTWGRMYLTIYEYFAGSVTYLGEVIKKNPLLPGKTIGTNFIGGFITPVFAGLTFLHILSYPEIFNVIGTYACEVLKIGSSTYYNAMPTAFGYFYIDGGLILTFVESWFFGYICKRIYLRALEGRLLFSAFYILIFVQICNMSTRWFFFSSDYCLAFVYVGIVMNKIIGGGRKLLELVLKQFFNKRKIVALPGKAVFA